MVALEAEGGAQLIDKGRILRRMLRFTGRIPNHHPIFGPFYQASQLKLTEEHYAHPALPLKLEGFRIAYASDIHFGPLLSKERLVDLAGRLNALKADIILLGGDYGEDMQTAIHMFEHLPPLHARHGLYCAIGNHDLMGTADELDRLLNLMKEKGFTPLINSAVTLDILGGRLCICSVDDVKRGKPDFEPIMAEAGAADFCIFAPHSPDAFPMALEAGLRFELCIAGHTHGGQLAVMGHALHSSSKYQSRYLSGWKREQGHDLFISNGVGCSLLPMRIGAPATYHLITLQKNRIG